jgi:hypothetical protein
MNYTLKASLALLLFLVSFGTFAQHTTHPNQNTTTGQNATLITSYNNAQVFSSTMQGSYAMLMQNINDGLHDSILNVQQFKIYTDRHFMYAHALPGDSLAYFGIGTYRMDNGKLTEYPFYTSDGGARKDTIDISITKLGNGYVQVINFPPDSQGRKYTLTEEYGNVSSMAASTLDGAWKLTKSLFIPKTGATTTNNNPLQFKIFQAGHFIWASTYTDSATQKPVSTFGYGTFEMQGPNIMKERTTNSTFRASLIGKPVTVQVRFLGKDAYEQTIEWPTGRSVETYQRL